jgi:hypothetical protein
MQWQLAFTSPSKRTIDDYARVLSEVAGAPATVEYGEADGNPRDGYFRGAYLRIRRGDVNVFFNVTQHMSTSYDDANAYNRIDEVRLEGDSFDDMLATWHALRDGLAPLGCIDHTPAKQR